MGGYLAGEDAPRPVQANGRPHFLESGGFFSAVVPTKIGGS